MSAAEHEKAAWIKHWLHSVIHQECLGIAAVLIFHSRSL